MTQFVTVNPNSNSSSESNPNPSPPSGTDAPPAEVIRHPRLTAFTIGTFMVVLLVAAALFAPWLSPYDPNAQHIAQRLLPPSLHHWLGTDGFGRDLLSRVIYGARPTLILISLIVVLTVPVG